MIIETPFELERRKIIVNGLIQHNDRKEIIRLIVDTGAGTSIISQNVALFLGFDLPKIKESEQFISASGRFTAKIISINHFEVLGVACQDFQVAVINLPPQSLVSGLIGVDFLMKMNKLTFDFDKKLVLSQF